MSGFNILSKVYPSKLLPVILLFVQYVFFPLTINFHAYISKCVYLEGFIDLISLSYNLKYLLSFEVDVFWL